MKNFTFIIAGLLLSTFLQAGVIEKSYYFGKYALSQKGEYSIVNFENTQVAGITGEPSLPYESVVLMLPPGENAVSIEFFGENKVLIPGQFNLYPHQPSRPLSEDGPFPFQMNESIYSQSTNYPGDPTGKLINSYLNGYAIAMCTFTPVEYNPAEGTLYYYQEVKIKINTEPSVASANAIQNLNASENIQARVQRFVQNPEMMKYYPGKSKSNDDYQLLIITPSQFESNFQELVDVYQDRGIKTQITTKETINSTGTGQDLQEKIRNYIIQEYQSHNVEYVMLGGDVEHVPYRGFYCYVVSGSGYEDNNIPADLYYSGLDGNWNTDNDNSWGEPGEDDLLPDIAVGRFSFSNVSELNNMLNKTISYQNNPVLGEFRDATLAGEWLYSSPDTWGSDYLETLIGYNNENGYETWGIPEDYNYHKLYEENQSWGASTLMAEINAGRQFIHHVGHANSTYVAYMSNSDITNNNFSGANGVDHNFTLFQSHGCICGAFDDSDCIMEKMVSIQNFAVAVIGNSRYGWFNEGQTEGPAAHLHREMVDAMYHEKINHLGAAFAECKIQTAPWVTAPGQWEEGALRWNFYDINILGDPTLSVWTDEPINIQVNYQSSIPMGVPSTDVTVTSGGNPMENFRCALIMDDVLYGVGITNASGQATIEIDPAFSDVGDAELIVSGYNCLPTVYPVSIIPNEGAYVVYASYEINDSQGNNNGNVDFGETILLTLEIENVGTVQANNVQVNLNTSDGYITINDGFENYGNIAGGATVTISNGFAFEVAGNIPDMHQVNFVVEINGDDTWTSGFSIVVHAPELFVGNISIDDSDGGNGDGILDPGEMADIIVQTSNDGHCASPAASGLISTNSSDITIVAGNCDLGVIETGETKDAAFTISVNPDAALGSSINIDFSVASGAYSAQQMFYLTIGLVVEDFETGDFSAFDWDFGGNADWTITNSNPYEGTYSAKSGGIGDEQESELTITMNVLAEDQISFFRKVSSEDTYDYLRFYIDGVQKGEWCGEEGWAEESYPVSAGTHTFKWAYEKDYSVANGSDCGWVDYIIFPAASGSGNVLAVNASANPGQICLGESSQLNAFATGGSGNYSYLWSPSTGLNNPEIYNPVATPDVTTTYTVTVNDGNNSISDNVTITVNPIPDTPVVTIDGDHLVSDAVLGNQWYDSDGMIGGATGQIYYPESTDYYYTIVTNTSGCSSGQSNAVYFVYTSISEIESGVFNIYPNPFKEHFTIEFNLRAALPVTIQVFDKLGRKVTTLMDNENHSQGLNQLQFNLNNLEQGIYYITLTAGDLRITRKLVSSE
ncbi:MAG: T9SS type A sorting domain-containing protein [Bacteroidales bacterium]|nr:T9SS type A sorting domain-containing protein [Bacteroidales bacterium]